MKTFAKSFATFWTGATAKRLAGHGPYVKLLATYLFSSPAALAGDNYGLFHVEREVMQRHIECDGPALDSAITVLAKNQFAYWDAETEWVWVREGAAWQYGTPLMPKDYVCTNARKWYKQLPRNPWLSYWFDRYVADLCLQFDADRWVDRREWDGEPPEIARVVAPYQPKKLTPAAPPKTKVKPFDRDRAIEKLQRITMNGAIGTAITAAVMKLQQGDVPLDIINRQLLDVCLTELGDQVEKTIAADLKKYKTIMPTAEYERVRLGLRDREVRAMLQLPELEERP